MKSAINTLVDEGYAVVMTTDKDENSVPKKHTCPHCESLDKIMLQDYMEDKNSYYKNALGAEYYTPYTQDDKNVYVGTKEDGSAQALCSKCSYWKTKYKNGDVHEADDRHKFV